MPFIPTTAVATLINVLASILPVEIALIALYAAINGATPGIMDSIGIKGADKSFMPLIVA